MEFFISKCDSPKDESLASFARRRLGREAYERIVQPLVAGIFMADAEQLSVAAALPQFVEMEKRHGGLIRAAWHESRKRKNVEHESGARYSLFVAPREGMSQLVDAVAARLPAGVVRLGAAVEGISKGEKSGWEIHLSGEKSSLHADGVILATPAFESARFLKGVDDKLAEQLVQIPYVGSVVVCLGYARRNVSHALDGFGFVVPEIEHRKIIAGSFSSVKYPGRAPEGDVLIRVFLGGAAHPEFVDAEDDELRRIATSELEELIGVAGEPIFCDVNRWPRSMPQYHLGHLDRVKEIERQVSLHPSLELAGNAYRGVGIPQSIYSGEQSAERMLSALA